MKFLLEEAKQIERHTETNLNVDPDRGTKHEEITIEIKLIGSGDTRGFASEEILFIIADRLKVIS